MERRVYHVGIMTLLTDLAVWPQASQRFEEMMERGDGIADVLEGEGVVEGIEYLLEEVDAVGNP